MSSDEKLNIFFIGSTGVGKASLVYAEVFYVHCDDPFFAPPLVNEHIIRRSFTSEELRDYNTDDSQRVYALTLVHDSPEFAPTARQNAYKTADILALCFSIGSESSLLELKTQWLPEILHHTPTTPIVLIGCKADLRRESDPETLLTTPEAGAQMAVEIGAVIYLECSSIKPMQNMSLVYVTLVKFALQFKRQRSNLTKARLWHLAGLRRHTSLQRDR